MAVSRLTFDGRVAPASSGHRRGRATRLSVGRIVSSERLVSIRVEKCLGVEGLIRAHLAGRTEPFVWYELFVARTWHAFRRASLEKANRTPLFPTTLPYLCGDRSDGGAFHPKLFRRFRRKERLPCRECHSPLTGQRSPVPPRGPVTSLQRRVPPPRPVRRRTGRPHSLLVPPLAT